MVVVVGVGVGGYLNKESDCEETRECRRKVVG